MKNQTFQFAAFSGLTFILLSSILLSCQDRDSMPASLKAENPTGTILKPQDLFLEDGDKDTTKLPPKKDRQHWLETEG
ncbi:hypothetical protein ACX3PU_05910 [Chryseobacterium sp. A301]